MCNDTISGLKSILTDQINVLSNEQLSTTKLLTRHLDI